MSNTKPKKPTKAQYPTWAVNTIWCDINQEWLFEDAMGNIKTKKARYAKGHSGNRQGTSSEVQKRIQEIRAQSTEAILNIGLPRLIKVLSQDKKLSVKEMVSIIKLLSEMGLPKQTEDITPPDDIKMPQIVISKEAIERARELDKDYQASEFYENSDESEE